MKPKRRRNNKQRIYTSRYVGMKVIKQMKPRRRRKKKEGRYGLFLELNDVDNV